MNHFFKEWWHHLKWHILVLPGMGTISWAWTNTYITATSPEKQSALVIYANAHPYRIGVILAAIYFTYKTIRLVISALIREKQYAAMVEGIGLREFSPHSAPELKLKNWEKCIQEIESSKTNSLQILGANGWDTFGSPQSPLHPLLEKFEGQIRILLLKDGSAGFKRRTIDLERNEQTYKEQIQDTLQFCQKLKLSYHKNIEVRLYTEDPIWKMILTDRYLWLQYYDPKQDVDDTPVYTLQTRNPPTLSSLYYPLTKVFEKRWIESSTEHLNLDTWVRT